MTRSPTGSASTTSGAAARSPTSMSSSCSRPSGRCCCSGSSARSLAFRQPTVLRAFLVWAFALSLAIYSWAGEKFAWLVLHPLLPLILLAGIGVQWLWESRGTTLGKAGLAVAAVVALYVPVASFLVNAEHRADPREFLVSTQSSESVKRVADQVQAMARKNPKLTITVDSADGATFPYAWYFRDLNVGYLDMSAVDQPPDSDVLILTEGSRTRLENQLDGLQGPPVPVPRLVGARLRQAVVGGWWRWFTRRKPWNPTGGLPEWLYTPRRHQRELGPEPAHGRDAPPRLNGVLRPGRRRARRPGRARRPRGPRTAPGRRRARRPRGCRGRGAGRPCPAAARRRSRPARLQRADGARERAGEDDDVVDDGGAVGMRRAAPRGVATPSLQRQPVRLVRAQDRARVDLEDAPRRARSAVAARRRARPRRPRPRSPAAPTPRAGRRGRSPQLPDRRAVAVEHAPAELVPLRHAGVAVGRCARSGRRRRSGRRSARAAGGPPPRSWRGRCVSTSLRRVPGSCAHCSSCPAQPITVGSPVKVEIRPWPNAE